MILLVAALAGGLGAAARFVVDGAVRARWSASVPLGTTVINVSGSLLLGVLTGLVLFHGVPSSASLVVGTGFLGGYTTFSTASVEVVRLLQEQRVRAALLHTCSMLVLSLGGAAVGLVLVAAL